MANKSGKQQQIRFAIRTDIPRENFNRNVVNKAIEKIH